MPNCGKSRPREKEYSLADGSGLFLRVHPNGTRSWLFNYFKPFTRARSNIGLGQYPAVGLASARLCRAEYQALLAQGIDPKAHREAKEQRESEAHSNTLERAARTWLALKRSSVTPAHAEDIERSLALHVFPKLGRVPVHMIGAKGCHCHSGAYRRTRITGNCEAPMPAPERDIHALRQHRHPSSTIPWPASGRLSHRPTKSTCPRSSPTSCPT
jgi:hypothetical protein